MTVSPRLTIPAVVLAIVTVVGLFVLPSRMDAPMASFPAITFETADGRTLSLADFHGRFVLLNVWATWCPPCVKEMPSLDRLQKMKSGRLEVVALSIDRRGLEVVEPFFRLSLIHI